MKITHFDLMTENDPEYHQSAHYWTIRIFWWIKKGLWTIRQFLWKVFIISLRMYQASHCDSSGMVLRHRATKEKVLQDVTTHLIDLVNWQCFNETIRYQSDVEVLKARHWPPHYITEFEQSTQADTFPFLLEQNISIIMCWKLARW